MTNDEKNRQMTNLDELIRASNPAAGSSVPSSDSFVAQNIARTVIESSDFDHASRRTGARRPLPPSSRHRVTMPVRAAAVACLLLVAIATPLAVAATRHKPSTKAPTRTGTVVATTLPAYVAPLVPPAGWVPVTLKSARLFVPASWTANSFECAAWSSPGTVWIRTASVLTAFCQAFPGRPQMLGPRDNAIILAPLALLRAPGRTIGTVSIAGFRANEYRWPVGWRASEHPVTWPAGTLEYEVPSLGLNIVASGPLALRVLATLRRTPITTRTYPSEGVTIAPSSDPVPTGESPAGALKSFRAQDQSALLGADLATETPTVVFAAVTEEHPTDAGIKPGQPYDAWVVTYARSPVVLYGPGTGTLPPGSHCQFVAIQDAGSRHWTNFFQNCS